MAKIKQLGKHRILLLLVMMTAILLWILIRLFWIQVVGARSYSDRQIDLVKNSVMQRQQRFIVDDGRGQFYDRHMIPLTGQPATTVVFFPADNEKWGGNEEQQFQLTQLARIIQADVHELQMFISELKEPQAWPDASGSQPLSLDADQVKQIKELDLPYVEVVDAHVRYHPDQLASHLIGYISQHPERIAEQFGDQLQQKQLTLRSLIGSAGLEKSFQRWLRANERTSLSMFVNSAGRIVPGLGMRTAGGNNQHYPLKIVTTIDQPLQQTVERLFRQSGIRQGAVVVLDPSNADVLAMASLPEFDPYHVVPEQTNWNNRAIQMTAPGSIFKTVVAAAALEEGVVRPDEVFECNGSLGKYGFHCWRKEGHGKITFKEAFADSCNITFAQVAKRLSADQLDHYAKRLGLLAPVGWQGKIDSAKGIFRQIDDEQKGQLFAAGTDQRDEGVLVQTAIGQRDVRMTPLQAANLIVTILNGGEVKRPRVVKEIRFQDGLLLESFPEAVAVNRGEGINKRTSAKILRWMREVITQGTGQSLKNARWTIAGKTGTAQVPFQGKEYVNQWFIGYGPTTSPKLAIAVIAEHVSPHAPNQVLPFVRKMMDAVVDLPIQ